MNNYNLEQHKGKFIVIDGADGSGKSTQRDLIVKCLKKKGYKIISYDLVQNPLSYLTVESKKSASSVLSFLEKLQDHEDVQKVFANVDIPQKVLDNMDSK